MNAALGPLIQYLRRKVLMRLRANRRHLEF